MEKKEERELLKIVKENYTQIAADFDETRKKKLWPELFHLASLAKDNDKILDAGCGNGRLIQAFKEKSVFYSGFDNSEELIALAKKNYPGYNFSVLDILNTSSITNKFYNLIFCVAVIPHVPGKNNRIKVLQDLYDKLVLGGEMIISFWDLKSQPKYQKQLIISGIKKFFGLNKYDYGDLIFTWEGKEKSKRYYHAFSEKEIRSLVEEAGLKLKELYKADNNFWLIIKKD